MLTVGSLFAGIGGFDLGFERAGMRTLWQVELDPYCRRVLERHFPDAQRFEDVRLVHGYTVQPDPPCDRCLAPVDIICGGFPCQDLSYAGKGAGLDGARSGLWSEYARIIRELRPRYVVVENVSALLARGLGRVLGDLAAIGYDAEWDCIPASALGAPHRRDRLWLVAYPRGIEHEGAGHEDERTPTPGLFEADPHPDSWRCEGGAEPDRQPVQSGQSAPQRHDADGLRDALADTESDGRGSGRPRRSASASARQREPERSLQDSDERALQPWRVGGRIAQAGGSEWWVAEPPVGRVAHGVPDRLDQLAALGNALVPQIAELIGRRIIEWEEGEVAA